MSIKDVTDQGDFDAQLEAAEDKLVVVYFSAVECGPCAEMAPKLYDMAEEYGDSVVFLKVDVDECEEVAESFGVSAMPTFLLFKNKEQVANLVGDDDQQLKDLIDEHK